MFISVEASLISVIVENFKKFDFLIFILAVINTVLLLFASSYSNRLNRMMNPNCWLPGGNNVLNRIRNQFKHRAETATEMEAVLLRRKMNTFYSLYENVTTIFPLMGLLGTVVSLLPMVSSMGEAETGLFFSALTSTMWGIIFAIIFKGCNGFIAGRLEDNDRSVETYLQRNTERIKIRNEADRIASQNAARNAQKQEINAAFEEAAATGESAQDEKKGANA